VIGTPFFIFFGWLSDKIGRKPIMMAGFLLAVVTYFPIFQGITHFANPALEKALAESPVTVVSDPAQCSFQLKLTGTEVYTKPCDVAKSALVARSVNYTNETAAAGAPVVVKVGNESFTAGTPDFVKNLNAAITSHGYPASADPKQINTPMTVLLLTILVIYVTMVYAPIAAFLVELFPTRIRYTGMSLPYHIGNGWFGGFLPATVFAIVAATGNIYSGLWYPIIIAAMSFVVCLIFLPETKDRDIHKI
jgi:nitrate/nitrite transporter NarK